MKKQHCGRVCVCETHQTPKSWSHREIPVPFHHGSYNTIANHLGIIWSVSLSPSLVHCVVVYHLNNNHPVCVCCESFISALLYIHIRSAVKLSYFSWESRVEGRANNGEQATEETFFFFIKIISIIIWANEWKNKKLQAANKWSCLHVWIIYLFSGCKSNEWGATGNKKECEKKKKVITQIMLCALCQVSPVYNYISSCYITTYASLANAI